MRYKKSDETVWGDYIVLTPIISENSFSYSAELGDIFNYQESYNFEFVVTDKIMSNTSSITVTQGIPIIDIGKNGVIVNGQAYMGEYKILAYDEEDNCFIDELGNKKYLIEKPYILYENSSGSRNDITLSDDVSNYSYIKIYYRNDINIINSQEFINCNNKDISLFMAVNRSDSQASWLQISRRNVSGNKITVVYSTEIKITNVGVVSVGTGNYMFITKVEGFK